MQQPVRSKDLTAQHFQFLNFFFQFLCLLLQEEFGDALTPAIHVSNPELQQNYLHGRQAKLHGQQMELQFRQKHMPGQLHLFTRAEENTGWATPLYLYPTK